MENEVTQKPKLFVLAPRVPNPTEKGDKLRMRHQLEELGCYFEIHLTCLSFGKVKARDFDAIRPLVYNLHVEQLPLFRALLRLAIAPFAKRPYQVMLYTDWWVKRRIQKRINDLQPSRIYCQMIRTSEYVMECDVAPKTLDIMDTLSVGMAREAESAVWWKRNLLRSESRRLKLYEYQMINHFESCCIISEQDRNLLPHDDRHMVHVVPNGVRTDYFNRSALPAQVPRFDVAFCGNLQYAPNVAACQYLAQDIAPDFEQLTGRPLKVLLCGASPSIAVRSLALKGKDGSHIIEVRGWVDDIRTAYLDAEIFVAPMQISTGQQNKLLEAMSLGIPCVTTPLSFNALSVEAGCEIVVCEDSHAFASTLEYLLNNPGDRQRIGAAGCKHVRESCSWNAASRTLVSILNSD